MTADELLAEARRIARPCVYLTKGAKDGPLAGVWGGQGLVPLDAANHRHWLTIDCRILPKEFNDLNLTGAISVYSDEEDCEGGQCVRDPRLKSINAGKRTPLYACPGTTLPSLALLLRSGTPVIRKWLAEVGCDLSAPFLTSHSGIKEVGDIYTRTLLAADPTRKARSPIYATLGGWPVEVYEDDWTEDVKDKRARQLVFTHADAEPWIRVWADAKGSFHVRQLIT